MRENSGDIFLAAGKEISLKKVLENRPLSEDTQGEKR